jgi:hypothetical protein
LYFRSSSSKSKYSTFLSSSIFSRHELLPREISVLDPPFEICIFPRISPIRSFTDPSLHVKYVHFNLKTVSFLKSEETCKSHVYTSQLWNIAL